MPDGIPLLKGDESMPYMRVSLTKKLTGEEKQERYGKLGQALALIPGKEAFMLIADIEDGNGRYNPDDEIHGLSANRLYHIVPIHLFQLLRQFVGCHLLKSRVGNGFHVVGRLH